MIQDDHFNMPKKLVPRPASGKHASDSDEEWTPSGNRAPTNQAEKGEERKCQATDTRRIAAEATAPCNRVKAGEKRSHEASEEGSPMSKRLASNDNIFPHLRSAHKAFLDCKQELLSSKTEVTQLEGKMKDYEDESKRLKNDIAKLQTEKTKAVRELRQLQKRFDLMRGEAIQALEEANIAKSEEPSPVSVGSVVQKWQLLQYNVYNLVVQHLTGTPRDNTLPEDSSTPRKLIEFCSKSPEMQVSLLERDIWSRLSAMWQSDYKVWAGTMGRECITFYRTMRERHIHEPSALSTLASMKATASKTLDANFGVDKDEQLKLLQAIFNRLKPFQKCPGNSDLYDSLSTVLEYAIDLTKWFMMARNMYDFGESFQQTVFTEIPYNKDTMTITNNIGEGPKESKRESVGQEPNFIVQVVLSPALYVTGTDEGEYFDQRQLLCPARVAVSTLYE